MLLLAPLAVLLAAWSPAPLAEERDLEGDTVFLNDGKSEQGWVVYEDPTVLVLRKGSKEKTISVYDIKEVDARSRHLKELLDRMDKAGRLDRASVDTLLELARFATHSRLPGEAELLYLQVLLADPSNAEANEALGGREKSKGWQIKSGGKWVKNEELDEQREWKQRWALQTAHFDIETDLPLSEAIATAFDTERMYRAFYDLYASELQLYDPDEIMRVQLHAGEKSFPEQGDGRLSHFGIPDRLTHANAHATGWRPYYFDTIVEQLIYMTSQWTRRAKGDVPPWVVEGLGEALATGTGGKPGTTTFDIGSVDEVRFRMHAADHEAFDMRQVLVFTFRDYDASKTGPLRYALSYSLVHFLLYGEGGKYNEPFLDFLRSSYEGQSSMSHFKKTVGDPKEMQEEWLQYVDGLVGIP